MNLPDSVANLVELAVNNHWQPLASYLKSTDCLDGNLTRNGLCHVAVFGSCTGTITFRYGKRHYTCLVVDQLEGIQYLLLTLGAYEVSLSKVLLLLQTLDKVSRVQAVTTLPDMAWTNRLLV
jgi:hypothetical protein